MSIPGLAMLIDRFMRRIHVRLRSKAHEFDTEHIGPAGAFVLLTLDDVGPIQIGELARILVRDKSQMTRSIGTLKQKGLVVTDALPNNERAAVVSLTEKGRAVVDVHKDAIEDAINAVLGPTEPEERQALERLLGRASPK